MEWEEKGRSIFSPMYFEMFMVILLSVAMQLYDGTLAAIPPDCNSEPVGFPQPILSCPVGCVLFFTLFCEVSISRFHTVFDSLCVLVDYSCEKFSWSDYLKWGELLWMLEPPSVVVCLFVLGFLLLLLLKTSLSPWFTDRIHGIISDTPKRASYAYYRWF